MTLKLANNASSTLASSIEASDLTLSVQSGHASRFPTMESGDWFPIAVVDGAGNREIMRVTGRAGAVLTVTRGQEGTTPRAFPSGAAVNLILSTAAIAHIQLLQELAEEQQATVRANIGLDQVNNTLDVDKPISTAVADALEALEEALTEDLDDLTDEVENLAERMGFPVAGGTANVLTLTFDPAVAALVGSLIISFTAASSNSAAATLNVDGLGAKALRKIVGTADVALVAGEIQQTRRYIATYVTAANGGAGAWVIVSGLTSYTAGTFRLQDGTDPTKQADFDASAIPAATKRTFKLPAVAGLLALLDAANQVVTGGARVTPAALGTRTSGTETVAVGLCPMQELTANGAFTLTTSGDYGSTLLIVTNGASAGAINITAFNDVRGSHDTTNGRKFHFYITNSPAGRTLDIRRVAG